MSHIQAGAERGGCPPAVRCRAVRRAGARAASRAVLFLAALAAGCNRDATRVRPTDAPPAPTGSAPSLELTADPISGEVPLRVRFEARLVGDVGAPEDFGCPTLAWTLDDRDDGEVVIAQPSGCAPGTVVRAFTLDHTYATARKYQASVRLIARDVPPSNGVEIVVRGATPTPAPQVAFPGPTIIIATPAGATPEAATRVAVVAAPSPGAGLAPAPSASAGFDTAVAATPVATRTGGATTVAEAGGSAAAGTGTPPPDGTASTAADRDRTPTVRPTSAVVVVAPREATAMARPTAMLVPAEPATTAATAATAAAGSARPAPRTGSTAGATAEPIVAPPTASTVRSAAGAAPPATLVPRPPAAPTAAAQPPTPASGGGAGEPAEGAARPGVNGVPSVPPPIPGRGPGPAVATAGPGIRPPTPAAGGATAPTAPGAGAVARRVLPADLYYLAGEPRQIWRLPVTGERPTRLTDVPRAVDAFAVSQTGAVAFTSGGGLYLLAPETGAVTPLDPMGDAPVWSRGGYQLAYAADGLQVYDVVRRQLFTVARDGVPLAWSRDGARLLARRADGGLALIAVATQSAVDLPVFGVTAAGWLPDRDVAWLVDGQGLALLSAGAALMTNRVAGLPPEPALGDDVMVRPDGRLLVAARSPAGLTVFGVDLAAGSLSAVPSGPATPLPDADFDWAPDGRHAALAGPEGVALFDPLAGAQVPIVAGPARQPRWVLTR